MHLLVGRAIVALELPHHPYRPSDFTAMIKKRATCFPRSSCKRRRNILVLNAIVLKKKDKNDSKLVVVDHEEVG